MGGNAQLRKVSEHGIAVASQAGTYRLREMKHDDALVDNVQHGSVPVLRYCQAQLEVFLGMPYSDEQREYCRVTVNYQIFRRGEDELTP